MPTQNSDIFALDIGTRTVVGLLLNKEDDKYDIKDSAVISHQNRAMYDGQIHDVSMVTEQVDKIISSLESGSNQKITEAAIAAAGRALETVESTSRIEFENKKKVTAKDVSALEYSAVQNAQEELENLNTEGNNAGYHFVGHTVQEYRVDGIFVTEIFQQQGSVIEVDVIATFLPQIVVDSLFSVIDNLDLDVRGLTLEPIAAAEVVVPRDMYNFNLALVDIGAGTADIAVTKGGSMVGYGMVPVAGDEITETIAEHFLIDYHAAEEMKCKLNDKDEFSVKDALGNDKNITSEEISSVIAADVEEMAGLIAEEILRLNQSSPRAVICIGGGSLTPGFTKKLSDYLDLDEDRVGIRDAEDLKNVSGKIEGINGTQMITPVGIGVNADKNRKETNFIQVQVNDINVSLFSIQKPQVRDALLQADIDLKALRAKPGQGLTYTLNGEVQSIPGSLGEPGEIKLNGEEVNLEAKISDGDVIEFKPGKKGKDAAAKVKEILPDDNFTPQTINIEGEKLELSPIIKVEGENLNPEANLQDGMDITYRPVKSVRHAVERLLEINAAEIGNDWIHIVLNGQDTYLPQSEIVITDGDNPVGMDEQLNNIEELSLDRKGPIKTVADLINYYQQNLAKINVTFNQNELEIPRKIADVLVNGETVDTNYTLRDGDEVKFKAKDLTVDEILDFINYGLSPQMKEEVKLLINGDTADFSSKISEKDRIELKFT